MWSENVKLVEKWAFDNDRHGLNIKMLVGSMG